LDASARSAYVGRGNVQEVRAARKRAGLNAAFPRSDQLLVEFAEHLRAAGAAEKDIQNKVDLFSVNKYTFLTKIVKNYLKYYL